jgi:hypothetical protein
MPRSALSRAPNAHLGRMLGTGARSFLYMYEGYSNVEY